MILIVNKAIVALRETPADGARHPAGTVILNHVVEKIADANVPNWIKVRVVGADPPREGFIHVDDATEQPVDAKIDQDRFIQTVSVAAYAHHSNAFYLYALAFAESEITNAGPAAGSTAIGPFQYTTQRWSELLAKHPESKQEHVGPDGRLDPYQQVTMAAITSGAAIKSLNALFGADRPKANELYVLHILGDADATALLTMAQDHADTVVDAAIKPPLSPAAAAIIAERPKLFQKGAKSATIADVLAAATSALGPGLDKAEALKDRLLVPTDLTATAADVGPVAEGALAWGAKVSAVFRDKVRKIASSVGTSPNYLMACMAFETGRTFSPSERNRGGGATGLIQFIPSTAAGLGTSTAALAAMTAEDQLDYVEKYFVSATGKLRDLGDVYMKILWPVAVGKTDDYVLFSQTKDPAAYSSNKGLDLNGDGQVTKLEAYSKVAAALAEGLKPGKVG